jgi:hypothetical protein
MPAGKWKLYQQAKKYLADGTHDLDDAANWKVALFLSTSNANDLTLAPARFGDLTNEHAAANGYAAGGEAAADASWTNVDGVMTFDIGDVVYTAAGGSITARFAVLYKDATVNGVVRPLLAVCLLDTTPADVTATDTNTLTITINAAGVFSLSGAASD